MQHPYTYDLTIIGAGPGGYEAAVVASKNGLKVAIIEEQHFGGTCLNTGCMATKTLLHTTELLSEINQEAATIGINCGEVGCDLIKLQERKQEVITKLRQAIATLMKTGKIEVYQGHGQLTAPHEITVNTPDGSSKTISSQFILITTGSKAGTLPLPGIEYTVSSDQILDSTTLYKKLIIIGGGVIGVEFASIYSALGTEVIIVEAADRILANMDKDISQSLKMQLAKEGVTIYTKANVSQFGKDGNHKTCTFSVKDQEMTIEADEILVSVGRIPNIDNLWNDTMALELNKRSIKVNENYQTSIEYIYAAGDVIGGIQLAHVATAEAINAVHHMLGLALPYTTNIVPACIYTKPEIATVGLTAEDAKEQGISTKVYKLPTTSNGKTLIVNGKRGFIKIIANADTKVIIGAQLMCERATDMITQLTLAVQYKMTVEQLEQIIYPHPTFNEAIGKALH